ncbi:YdiU family protein [Proteobacteria bacterium 005FR1]|nr:YdiU family protein [Proteobacteria bacterium 005FR1]
MTSSAPSNALQFVFDNSFVTQLPADPEAENFRRQVIAAAYSRVQPTPVKNPQLVACSADLAREIGLDPASCESEEFVQVFSGNHLLPGMDPFAMCYGGHQFGNWAGQLGDGRAINLGEILVSNKRWTLQLKGAGPTPYSRGADGLAVLRSSIREFLCSEAMHHLGVPTTRALSVVDTGEQVMRDILYDGHPEYEPGAVVCRAAPSFIRFGNFEILAARQEYQLLQQLADYTIRTHFPHLGEPGRNTYIAWFDEVCRRTVDMIVHWMRVGFVHGVMNTDNMSVHGITIDYGPYGWLDDYDPDWTPNITDAQGRRYRFANQPGIAQWNLIQFGNAIYPLIEDADPLRDILESFGSWYSDASRTMKAAKLGLQAYRPQDGKLFSELDELLTRSETDMTIFYRSLAKLDCEADPSGASAEALLRPLLPAYYQADQLTAPDKEAIAGWLRCYVNRVRAEGRSNAQRRQAMNSVNPKYVLRNYLAQQAIERAEQGDHALVRELLDLLRKPYEEQPDREAFFAKRPEWARNRPGCSMLSCSS